MRKYAIPSSMAVEYFLGDQLGSTSLTTDSTGAVVSELRYTAWGEVRYKAGTTPTNYTYTGQYSNTVDFGLMFYNARWYDPGISEFTSPDTIIPNLYNSLDWNRYGYARYNPLKYTDPSGHCSQEGDDWCYTPTPVKKKQVPVVPPTATGNLDSDEFGREILNRYLSGGGDWYIISDSKWSDYMSNNPTLKEDLQERAVANAQFMLKNGYKSINIDESYPMEIENGEAMIGYQYLHGTNQDLGGFSRLGVATMTPSSSGGHNVTFSMAYTWNDAIDPNPKYSTDVVKSSFAEIITLGKAASYNIHITWLQTIVIHLDPNGTITP